MAEQGQSPDLYLSGPEEPIRRRRKAVPGAVACLVIASLLGLIAATHTPGAATSRVGTDSPDSVSSQDGSQLAISHVILPARERHLAVAAHVGAATAVSTSAAPPQRIRAAAASETTPGFGCSFALAWLAGHAAPGFRFECPGYALGHQAMTCANVAGVCPGARLIVIADPCPAAYMNEANNSWIVVGLRTGQLDPYGYCQ
jgi:hypothetical protein